jgi:hexosaminidase
MKPTHLLLLPAIIGAASLSVHAEQDRTVVKDPKVTPPIAAIIDPSAPGIVPWPMRGEIGKGRIPLAPTARIVAATPELVPLTRILSGQILKLSGRELPVAEGTPQPGDILLRIQSDMKFADDPYLKINPELKGYEHRITANAKGVLIEGVDYKSTALATATLLQSLSGKGPALAYPPIKIEDKPGCTYSGLMLDVARQFHPIEILKVMVEMCQLYKIPYFHLHLTDDQGYRLPSKAFPQLATVGASYSDAEIRDLVAYADARGVTIIPEVEVPGHSGAMQGAIPEIFGAKNEETGKFETMGVINIASEEIYPVLEKIVAENCEIFKSSPYFHIGGDESNFSVFHANPTVQKQIADLEARGVTTKDQLFAHFLNKMNAIVKKNGKKTLCWEGFGSDQKVDKDVTIFAWHGQSYSPITLLDNGYRIVNVPWTVGTGALKDFYEWNMWYLNLNESGASHQFDVTPQIIGGSMVMWERAPEEILPILRPKTPNRHERLYSPYADRTYADYAKRYEHTDAVFEQLVYPVDVKFDGLINKYENLYVDPVTVTLSSPVPGAKLYYNFHETDVTLENAKEYTGPFQITAEQSRWITIPGYSGPRTDLRVRAFGPDNKPIGSAKLHMLRNQLPQFEFTIYDLPPGTKDFPADTSKLKRFDSGVLARVEASHDMGIQGPPRLFEARGYIDVRTAGTYKGQFIYGSNNRHARLRVDGGKWLDTTPRGVQMEFTFDKTGPHLFEVQQLGDDGIVGIAWSCESHPPDPEPPTRRFLDGYFSQWFAPLPEKLWKKK